MRRAGPWLHEAAEQTGRATALLLVQYPNARGHALGAHRFADGQIAYFDLHGAPGNRVFVGNRREASLGRASAVIIDGIGHDVTQRAQSSSVVNALIDPVGDPRYGCGGVESEYRGGYLAIPKELFNPDEPDAAVRLIEQLGWLARNEGNGIKMVIDAGVFDVTEDGTKAMAGQAPIEDVRAEVIESVPEFVTDRPIKELRTDPPTNGPAAVQILEQALARFDGLPRPGEGHSRSDYSLADLLPAPEGWAINPRANDVRFVPVPIGDAATVVTHHTKGVPLGDINRFMRSIGPRIQDSEQSQLHHDGEDFTQWAVKEFRRWSASRTAPAGDRPSAVEQRKLYAAMWLTYLHVGAPALAAIQPPDTAKHRSAVALRQSLRTVHDELSPRAQDFLHGTAELIRARFERQFLTREPDFSAVYVERLEFARRVHRHTPKLHVEPPAPSKHTEHRPLQAVRYAALSEKHSRYTLKVGDYLDTMLLRDRVTTVNQYEAFGVHSQYPDLDRAGSGPGLVLLELRNDSGGS